MEHHNIAPHPVHTPEELIAKMDMIIAGIKQLEAGAADDSVFVGTVIHRMLEVKTDCDVMDNCTPEQGDAVMRKLDEIAEMVAKVPPAGFSNADLN